jgi:hypothetical protein
LYCTLQASRTGRTLALSFCNTSILSNPHERSGHQGDAHSSLLADLSLHCRSLHNPAFYMTRLAVSLSSDRRLHLRAVRGTAKVLLVRLLRWGGGVLVRGEILLGFLTRLEYHWECPEPVLFRVRACRRCPSVCLLCMVGWREIRRK